MADAFMRPGTCALYYLCREAREVAVDLLRREGRGGEETVGDLPESWVPGPRVAEGEGRLLMAFFDLHGGSSDSQK